MSLLNVNKVDPSTGTALEIGTSGDTITVPTGAGLTVTDEVKTNKISPATGTAFALGDSGDTFTVPSGATFNVAGTLQSGGAAIANNTPNFYVIRSGAQAISQNVYSKIQYNSETWDSDSAFDTSNNKFTVPAGEAGKYVFGVVWYLEGMADMEQFRLKIYKNGSAHAPEPLVQWFSPGATDSNGFTSIVLNLAVSDYIEIYAYHNGGTTENLASGNNTFFGYKLAE